MTQELNWREKLHWDLFKQFLGYRYEPIHECYKQSKIATEQFINNLAADAREELESTGWKDDIESYQESYTNHRNSECYHAVYRALSQRPLNH